MIGLEKGEFARANRFFAIPRLPVSTSRTKWSNVNGRS